MGELEHKPDLFALGCAYLNKEIGLVAFKAALRDLGMPSDEIEDYIDELVEGVSDE